MGIPGGGHDFHTLMIPVVILDSPRMEFGMSKHKSHDDLV